MGPSPSGMMDGMTNGVVEELSNSWVALELLNPSPACTSITISWAWGSLNSPRGAGPPVSIDNWGLLNPLMTLRLLPAIATSPSFGTAASKESVLIEADKGRPSANRSTSPTVEVEVVACGAAASVKVGWTGKSPIPGIVNGSSPNSSQTSLERLLKGLAALCSFSIRCHMWAISMDKGVCHPSHSDIAGGAWVPEDVARVLCQLPGRTLSPWNLSIYTYKYIGHYKDTHALLRRVGSHSESREPQCRPQSGYGGRWGLYPTIWCSRVPQEWLIQMTCWGLLDSTTRWPHHKTKVLPRSTHNAEGTLFTHCYKWEIEFSQTCIWRCSIAPLEKRNWR